MDIQTNAVALAALLHDIGKFYQRADRQNSKQFSDDLKSTFCPFNSQRNYYSHVHVLWTHLFIEEHKEKLKSVLQDQYDLFYRAAVAHHKPNESSIPEKIIQKADHYSSGVDRQNDTSSEKDAEDEHRWDSFKKKRMYSIFESIHSSGEKYNYRLPIQSLSIKDDKSFPKQNGQFDIDGDQEYRVLWEKFTEEFKGITAVSFEAFFETLLHLLEKYTHAVPSSTMHLPDVSLYDHLKSTSALAVCISEYLNEKNGLEKLDISNEDAPVLLVGGDVSGIQSFIYDIISTNAAKNLKGRSFYLQMLVDNLLQQLLDELQLPSSQVVYASGGGFYLLIPNIPSYLEKVDNFATKIEAQLFQKYGTSLYLAMSYHEVSQGQIMNQKIDDVWVELSQLLNEKKRQRYASVITSDEGYKRFFEPLEVGGESLRDVITNEEITQEEITQDEAVEYLDKDKEKKKKEELELVVKKHTTFQQIRLGKVLKDTDYWVVSKEKITYWEDKPFEALPGSYYNYFISKHTLQKKHKELASSADQVSIRSLNNTSLLSSSITGNNNIYGFAFYGGNKYPQDEEGAPQYFDQLAEGDGEGLNRLGVLRMDVDNLGNIFKSGFNNKQRTFSRYATLSRNLDLFFKGYLNSIWSSSDEYKSYTYILYSGGDDLFIVGKWNVLIDLAKEIRLAFQQWTCHNPKLSLSGGIAIVPGKFPIAKGASLAEVAEKLAKAHQYHQVEKNAFSLLNYSLNWDAELPLVEKLKDEMVRLIDQAELPKGILQRIMAFHEQAWLQKNKDQNESWRWQMAYHFSQAAKGTKNEDTKAFLSEIQLGIFTDKNCYTELAGYQYQKDAKSNFFYVLNLAARWAELEIRN